MSIENFSPERPEDRREKIISKFFNFLKERVHGPEDEKEGIYQKVISGKIPIDKVEGFMKEKKLGRRDFLRISGICIADILLYFSSSAKKAEAENSININFTPNYEVDVDKSKLEIYDINEGSRKVGKVYSIGPNAKCEFRYLDSNRSDLENIPGVLIVPAIHYRTKSESRDYPPLGFNEEEIIGVFRDSNGLSRGEHNNYNLLWENTFKKNLKDLIKKNGLLVLINEEGILSDIIKMFEEFSRVNLSDEELLRLVDLKLKEFSLNKFSFISTLDPDLLYYHNYSLLQSRYLVKSDKNKWLMYEFFGKSPKWCRNYLVNPKNRTPKGEALKEYVIFDSIGLPSDIVGHSLVRSKKGKDYHFNYSGQMEPNPADKYTGGKNKEGYLNNVFIVK